MGQTLTYGVYLPDEGERNCYSGLAQNWQILDDAVGAIAGKANASHTHGNISNDGAIGSTSGLPVITGTDGILTTGTFGNTAGTFCEGNDSRLSDARTPVAHTHNKSDITDLLNSNFIPSANNSYDLGSSSYQWNNLYAKNYFYNGTQWGLDRANAWSRNQSVVNAVTPKFILQDTRNDRTYSASATLSGGVMRWECDDKDGAPLSRISTTLRGDKVVQLQFAIFNEDSSGTEFDRTIRFAVDNTGSAVYYPEQTGNVDLGDSTHKWKTLNGINPGALSLPSTDLLNVAPNITALDGVTQNKFTPQVDGWLLINGTGPANDGFIYVTQGRIGMMSANNSAMVRCAVLIPVVAGREVSVNCKLTTLTWASIATCLGNV